MSKEEILKRSYEKVFGSQKYEKSNLKSTYFEVVALAMDDYALNQCINFAEWSMTNDIVEGSTPLQMYAQFLHQNKD